MYLNLFHLTFLFPSLQNGIPHLHLLLGPYVPSIQIIFTKLRPLVQLLRQEQSPLIQLLPHTSTFQHLTLLPWLQLIHLPSSMITMMTMKVQLILHQALLKKIPPPSTLQPTLLIQQTMILSKTVKLPQLITSPLLLLKLPPTKNPQKLKNNRKK